MATRAEFVAAVRSMVGTPFRHRGRLRGVGLDCVGVPIAAMQLCGAVVAEPEPYGTMPGDVEGLLGRYCDRLVTVEAAQPGDLLAILWASVPRHVAVLVEPGLVAHARARSGKVALEPLTRGYEISSAWRIRGLD